MRRELVVIIILAVVVMIIMTMRARLLNRAESSSVNCNCPLHLQPMPPSTSSEGVDSITAREPVSRADQPEGRAVKLSAYLLIMVPIRPNVFTKRKLIRSTWFNGYKDNNEVVLRFVVGTKGISRKLSEDLREENSTFGDVVFIDQKETSRALTNKTISLIKWAADNVEFTYMMKCDDDTYVYVDNVITELKKRPTNTSLYYGKMIHFAPVMRNRRMKWSDPHWDLGDTYMPYALGGGYILSSDLVVMLAEQSDYLKWHPNEDTAVGSWLVPYEYERRSDELVCVYDVNGTLKYSCVEKFPMFHIFYSYPQDENPVVYFHKLYNEYSEYAVAKEGAET